jgi:hypothetical protein
VSFRRRSAPLARPSHSHFVRLARTILTKQESRAKDSYASTVYVYSIALVPSCLTFSPVPPPSPRSLFATPIFGRSIQVSVRRDDSYDSERNVRRAVSELLGGGRPEYALSGTTSVKASNVGGPSLRRNHSFTSNVLILHSVFTILVRPTRLVPQREFHCVLVPRSSQRFKRTV